jgi:hypothetical protein
MGSDNFSTVGNVAIDVIKKLGKAAKSVVINIIKGISNAATRNEESELKQRFEVKMIGDFGQEVFKSMEDAFNGKNPTHKKAFFWDADRPSWIRSVTMKMEGMGFTKVFDEQPLRNVDGPIIYAKKIKGGKITTVIVNHYVDDGSTPLNQVLIFGGRKRQNKKRWNKTQRKKNKRRTNRKNRKRRTNKHGYRKKTKSNKRSRSKKNKRRTRTKKNKRRTRTKKNKRRTRR